MFSANASSDIEELTTKSDQMSDKLSELEETVESLRQDNARLFNKSLQLETYSRRDNLIFEGVKETLNEDCQEIVSNAFKDMDLDIAIVRAHRYGPRGGSNRPIIIRLLNYDDKFKILAQRRSLSGSQVVIREDYPPEIERRRKILWPYIRAAYAGDPLSPETKVKAYLRGDKLVINNHVYRHDNLQSLPSFVKDNFNKPPSSRTSNNVTVFFSKDSPLSNFHRSRFEVDDVDYNSVEQYLSVHKAMLFDTAEVAKGIMRLDKPEEQKKRVKKLKNFNHDIWSRQAGPILDKALFAKFSQNENLKDYLIKTGSTTLGEASAHDRLFGIGLSIHNPNALDLEKWHGQNLQGTGLMKVRQALIEGINSL